MNKNLKEILVEWEDGQDVMDANLPMCVTIPAEMADRIGAKVTVPMHFRSETFGYPVLAWQDNF